MDLLGLRAHVETLSGEWGHRVKERRLDLRLTQAQLADLVGHDGVTVQTISKLERGELRPRDYLKLALALALCVEVVDLFPMPKRSAVAHYAKKAA
jgi:DNA-binding XRE family transcriptional regulator